MRPDKWPVPQHGQVLIVERRYRRGWLIAYLWPSDDGVHFVSRCHDDYDGVSSWLHDGSDRPLAHTAIPTLGKTTLTMARGASVKLVETYAGLLEQLEGWRTEIITAKPSPAPAESPEIAEPASFPVRRRSDFAAPNKSADRASGKAPTLETNVAPAQRQRRNMASAPRDGSIIEICHGSKKEWVRARWRGGAAAFVRDDDPYGPPLTHTSGWRPPAAAVAPSMSRKTTARMGVSHRQSGLHPVAAKRTAVKQTY